MDKLLPYLVGVPGLVALFGGGAAFGVLRQRIVSMGLELDQLKVTVPRMDRDLAVIVERTSHLNDRVAAMDAKIDRMDGKIDAIGDQIRSFLSDENRSFAKELVRRGTRAS